MDIEKIKTYERETGLSFPQFTTLNSQEAKCIKGSIYHTCHRSEDESATLFSQLINSDLMAAIEHDDTENLRAIINSIPFSFSENIYLYWDDEHVDMMSLKELTDIWNYVWYSSAEEAIILYDDVVKKLLMIAHWGAIYYTK